MKRASDPRVRRIGCVAAGVLLLTLVGCAGSRPGAVESDSTVQHGKASYYSDSLQGRPTASGEPYDRAKLTAAHRTLPFGTRVLVTNLGNGESVELRINDRGPFVKGRIIDLSRRGAQALDMIQLGVIEVSVEVIE